MQHTPGPWTSSGQRGRPGHCFQAQVWGPDGKSLAVLEPILKSAEASANARLMSASPEMLESLIDLRKAAALLQQNSEGCAFNHYGNDIELNGLPGWLADTKASIDHALAVIAKACPETNS